MINKKRLIAVLMAGITLTAPTSFTACKTNRQNSSNNTSVTYLKDEFINSIIDVLGYSDTSVTYVEKDNYYMIEYTKKVYDADTKEYIDLGEIETYTISKEVASKQGLIDILENKIAKQNSIKR